MGLNMYLAPPVQLHVHSNVPKMWALDTYSMVPVPILRPLLKWNFTPSPRLHPHSISTHKTGKKRKVYDLFKSKVHSCMPLKARVWLSWLSKQIPHTPKQIKSKPPGIHLQVRQAHRKQLSFGLVTRASKWFEVNKCTQCAPRNIILKGESTLPVSGTSYQECFFEPIWNLLFEYYIKCLRHKRKIYCFVDRKGLIPIQ